MKLTVSMAVSETIRGNNLTIQKIPSHSLSFVTLKLQGSNEVSKPICSATSSLSICKKPKPVLKMIRTNFCSESGSQIVFRTNCENRTVKCANKKHKD